MISSSIAIKNPHKKHLHIIGNLNVMETSIFSTKNLSVPFQFHLKLVRSHYRSLPMHKLTPCGLWQQ